MSPGDLLPASERLSFRRMSHDDLDAMAALLGDPDVMRHYPAPKTREEAGAWIRWNLDNYARDGFGLWVIEDPEGRFVGDCGLTWQQVDGATDLELGYHVLPRFQGQGLATEAARACRDLATSRGLERLIAIVRPDNLASRRVAEKVGLHVERTTTVRDLPVVLYAMRLHRAADADVVRTDRNGSDS